MSRVLQNKILIRAEILAIIREFFAKRSVLEVETPLLCLATITAPYLHSFCAYSACGKNRNLYLQTSPEFEMKKLLAKGSGDIYQMCKAFRDEESGKLHNAEFTILEWYRIGFNHHDLMDEMDALLNCTLGTKKADRFSYAEIFQKYLNINPHTANVTELRECALNKGLNMHGEISDKDEWLQLLLSNFIEPNIGQRTPAFIYDYPPSQAALAKIRNDKTPVAERFEVYFHGIELANGFHELNNSAEQRARFEQDLVERKKIGLPEIPIDEELLALLEKIPNCAGVALGIDRLLMLAANAASLSDVVF